MEQPAKIKMKILFVLSTVVSLALCGPVIPENDLNVLKSVVGNFVNCVHSDLSLCLKEKALLVTERVSGIRELKILDGFTIINNAPEKEGRSYEPLSSNLDERKRQISEILFERVGRLLENTDLEVSVSAFDEAEEARSVGEDRGKKKKEVKKKLKILLPLLLILKAKVIALVTLSIVVIAKSVLKLAILAKLAFLYKLFLIIKELIHKHHHGGHDEGWIPHEEHHEHHGHGWDGGWSRTRNEANNLAYSAYNQ